MAVDGDDLDDDQVLGNEEEVVEDDEQLGGDEETVAGEEGEEEGQQAPRRSRATERVLHFREEARAAQQRADDLQRQIAQLQEQVNSRQSSRTAEEEAQRLAMMTPEERVEHYLQIQRREHQSFVQQQQFQTADVNDRATFQSMVRGVPEYEKLAPQVENELAAIRQQFGWNVPRQLVMAALIGIETMKSRDQVGKARAQGQARIQKQKVRPAGGASDVQRRLKLDPNSPEARRARLEDATF